MAEHGPAAQTLDVEDAYPAINALYQERGWADGLPIVPPTEELVREFLHHVDRDPREVIGIVAPRQGEATVEKIAINAIMAGCRPEYLPVVIAAVDAVCDPAFGLDSIQPTTHPVATLIIVNGPIARELGINSGYNAFGPGFQANATIGRALRLVLMNIGGGLPGIGDRATQGTPAKFTYCVAENEAASPWEPLHVQLGYPASASTVTLFGAEGPHNINDHSSTTAEGILTTVAGSMGQAGSNNLGTQGWPLLCLSPEHAATIAADGYSKQDVCRFVFEHARFPFARLAEGHRPRLIEMGFGLDTMLPIADGPETITVIVVGDAGKHSSWQPTLGHLTRPVTRLIWGDSGAKSVRR